MLVVVGFELAHVRKFRACGVFFFIIRNERMGWS